MLGLVGRAFTGVLRLTPLPAWLMGAAYGLALFVGAAFVVGATGLASTSPWNCWLRICVWGDTGAAERAVQARRMKRTTPNFWFSDSAGLVLILAGSADPALCRSMTYASRCWRTLPRLPATRWIKPHEPNCRQPFNRQCSQTIWSVWIKPVTNQVT